MQNNIHDSQNDFRIVLQSELLSRIQRNPSYSIRSFARSLEYDPSMLNKLISGKTPASVKTIERLGKKIGLAPDVILRLQHKSIGVIEVANEDISYQELTADQFYLISEWYHYAILEVIKIKNFKPSRTNIAKTLGLSIHEVRAAIERLVRLGLLKIESSTTWIDTSEGFTSALIPGYTDEARRKIQKDLLSISTNGVDEVPISQRDNSSVMMAIDSKNLPSARELIRKFRNDMSVLLSKGNKDSVYNLSIALCPLTKDIHARE